MNAEDNYLEINRNAWNTKTAVHLRSDFYDLDGFLKGASSLNEIEMDLLGDIGGKRILHLQCHFGQDSISLGRLGAKVTGVDLSDKAIEQARALSLQTHSDAEFICCDIYDLPRHLDKQFDIVFTSYGTIGWLPDLDKWAKVIYRFLKPGGRFVFAEFHPVVWVFDDQFKSIRYNYFNSGAIVESTSGTYAEPKADIQQECVMWNHGMGEVVNSLIQHGLELRLLNEYDYSPYNCFQHTVEVAPKRYRIVHLDNKIPMVYALVGVKREVG